MVQLTQKSQACRENSACCRTVCEHLLLSYLGLLGVVDELLELLVQRLEQPLALLVLALQTRQHERQERLVTQQRDAAKHNHTQTRQHERQERLVTQQRDAAKHNHTHASDT